MENNNSKKEISLIRIVKLSWDNRKLFVIVLLISFVISCIIVLSRPRYYTCEVKLAPELEMSGSSSLSSIASSFGFDLGNAISQDAIPPTLYPDLMESNDFIIKLFDIDVVNNDKTISTNYYDYLKNYQKVPWWSYIISSIKKLFPTDNAEAGGPAGSAEINAFQLTKNQTNVAAAIKANIKCNVDKKTDVISISVTDQDKLICATMADSVRVILQDFITDYRTNKARNDYQFYTELNNKAKKEYTEARRKYSRFADANTNLTLETYRTELNELENDMQMKYNTYSALNTQLQAAKAKVQEKTPAFTTLQCATVPIKPAGPKRMLFVIGVSFLAFTCTLLYVLRKDLMAQL